MIVVRVYVLSSFVSAHLTSNSLPNLLIPRPLLFVQAAHMHDNVAVLASDIDGRRRFLAPVAQVHPRTGVGGVRLDGGEVGEGALDGAEAHAGLLLGAEPHCDALCG